MRFKIFIEAMTVPESFKKQVYKCNKYMKYIDLQENVDMFSTSWSSGPHLSSPILFASTSIIREHAHCFLSVLVMFGSWINQKLFGY